MIIYILISIKALQMNYIKKKKNISLDLFIIYLIIKTISIIKKEEIQNNKENENTEMLRNKNG